MMNLFSAKAVKILLFCFINFIFISCSNNQNLEKKDIQFCKTSFEQNETHLIEQTTAETAEICIKALSYFHDTSFEVSQNQNDKYWSDFFLNSYNSLYVYNNFLLDCEVDTNYVSGIDEKIIKSSKSTDLNNRDVCDTYKKFFLEASLRGDKTFLAELYMDESIISDFYNSDWLKGFTEIRDSLATEEDLYFFKKFDFISIEYANDCSNYEEFKNYDHKKLSEYLQASFFRAMDYCAYDAEDIYVYLNNKKILDFLETDKIFFRWKESDISNNLIFYASNYGPKSYYKKINEIFKQRFSLENTQLNFVNRWLENRFSMKFFNFPDLESLILTYLNFGSLDRMENFTYPEDFKESRDDFIYAIDDWIDRSVDTAVRSELLTYSDAGLTVLELGNIFHCDLSSEYFDEALDIYNQTPDPIDTFEPIVTLSLYENLIMLSNCYIERASYNFSSGGSFKPFRNNSLIRSEPDVENLEKASIYLKDAEELFQPIKNDKEYLIAKTFFQFNKERINFLKGNKKFDENKLLEIFSYLIQNQEKVPALSWTPFIEELLFSYSSYLSVLTKMEMPTDNLIPSSELQQMLERINNLNALKYSQLLNNIDYKNLKKNYKENSKKILNLEKKGSEQNKEKLRLLYEDRKKIINKIYSIDEKFNDFKNSNFNNLDRFVKKLDEKEAIVSFQTSYSGIAITVKTRDESKIFFNHYTNKYQIEMFTSFLRNEIKNGGETGNFNFDWSFFLYIDLFSQVDGYLKGDYTIYIYGSELDDLPFATLISNPVGIEANRDISADDEIWDLEGSVADHLRNSSSYRKYMEADWLLNKYNFVRLYPVRAKSADIFDGKFLGFGNSVFLKTGLNDLPNVREEIEFLALASQSKKSIFFDEDASKENFIKMSEKNYERLAIATHSVEPFWNGLTTEPALIFNDSHKDFILSASEISTMDINSDMTILSVCNSDMTDFNAIYKSFLVAGSNSVIYTHWGVEDEAASKLTGDFFKRLWFDPEMKKHVALRKAILEMKSDLNDEKFAHPAFWGNFSLAYSSIN